MKILNPFSLPFVLYLGFGAICLSVVAERASATALNSGTISGVFTDPVLAGNTIDEFGNLVFHDNTNTAVFNGFGTNSIKWGASPGGNSLTFVGASFSGVQPGQPFFLGTLTYFNTMNLNQTGIFGATLTLTVSNSQVAIDPAVSHAGILATANTGVSQARDADFITFDVLPVTFNVYEEATASAKLFGQIVGDPQLQITGIELAEGQAGNGFIGHGQPSVPDTGTTLFLLGGCVGTMVLARRKLLA
jgi:hypothetical protein